MNKTWSVIIAVLITAVFGVGGSYYYLNTKASEEKAELQEQIEELKEDKERLELEVKGLQSDAREGSLSELTPDAETKETTTVDWKKYSNTKYGFGLNFNDNWKGYELISKDVGDGALDTLYVCVPTNSTTWNDIKEGVFCPMAISVVKISQWADYQSLNEPVVPVEVARNSSYVFTKATAQDRPEDGTSVMNDINNIIDTFSAFDI